jgi:hypothetical protein
VQFRIILVLGQPVPEAFERLAGEIRLHQRAAQALDGLYANGRDRNGAAKKRDGIFKMALQMMRAAEVDQSPEVVGLDFQRTLETFDGRVVVALLLQGLAEVVVGDGTSGIESNDAAMARNRVVEFAHVAENIAQVGQGGDIFGFDGDNLAETIGGGSEVASGNT